MGADEDRLATEADLIAAAQHDAVAFGLLYEEHFDTVYTFVARRVGSRAEAEDVTSVVFHRALAALPRFEWRGIPFVAWLLRIARNEVTRQQRRPTGEPLADDLSVEQDEIEDAERRALVARLLRALPPDQRRVLTLRFAHDLSIRQVATALGRTEGAVKQLQHRGLETLRRLEGAV